MQNDTVNRVLLVDDEPAVLQGLVRQHRKHFDLVPAVGPEAAIEALEKNGPFALVVSDYQMPNMNGAQFLAKSREIDPDMIRIMLTGQADLTTAADAVNRGNVFRFLTKPCEPEMFRAVLEAGIQQYSLVNAERMLLEHTVKGAIEVMAEILSLAHPTAFGRAVRVRDYVAHVVKKLRLRDPWLYETAALLSQIGCAAIPNDVFERLGKGEQLPEEQLDMLSRHPQLSGDLLDKIPRLQTVAEIVRLQQATKLDTKKHEKVVIIGSRILAAALDFEELLSVGAKPASAMEAMRGSDVVYDERILAALASATVDREESSIVLLPLSKLRIRMTLEEDVRNSAGMLIVTRGHKLTVSSLQRLRNYADLGLLQKSELRVRPAPPKEDGKRYAA